MYNIPSFILTTSSKKYIQLKSTDEQFKYVLRETFNQHTQFNITFLTATTKDLLIKFCVEPGVYTFMEHNILHGSNLLSSLLYVYFDRKVMTYWMKPPFI